jgi:DNA modification methylase
LLKVTWLSEEQKVDYRMRDNTTNLLSEYDFLAMEEEIRNTWEWSYDLIDHLEWFNHGINLFQSDDFNEEIEDEVPEIKPQDVIVKKWDIFKLWDHYLMCGDSTSHNDTQKLMQGQKANMIFTDPPYNVNYKWQWKNTSRWIENDHMSDDNFDLFLNDVFARYKETTKNEAWVYVFHSTSTQAAFERSMLKNDFEIKNQLIWNKPSAALWWWAYRWKHEPFYYASIKNTTTNFYWDRTHSTVIETLQWKSDVQILNIIKRAKKAESEWKGTIWSMSRASVSWYVHPTQKPVELIEYALKNSSKPGNIVTDFFGGSGSTLVACEKTWRECRTMELDPHFVQVILKRYHEVTNGLKEITCINRKIDISKIVH